MLTNEVVADAPQYVLMDGNCRIGPRMVPSSLEVECPPIYGFSAAPAYAHFRAQSEQTLTPYPLVNFYLRTRVGAAGDEPRLVVVDAAGPREQRIYAVTVEAVLEARENGSTHVTASYALTFDQERDAYRIEEAVV